MFYRRAASRIAKLEKVHPWYTSTESQRDKEFTMPSSEEIQIQLELLATHRRTHAILRKQLAIHGLATAPSALIHSLDEVRTNIRRCKAMLDSWGVGYEDFPDESTESDILGEVLPFHPICVISANAGRQATRMRLLASIGNAINFDGGHFCFHPKETSIVVCHPKSLEPVRVGLPGGRPLHWPDFQGSGHGVSRVCYSPDGRFLAYGGVNGEVVILSGHELSSSKTIFSASGWRVSRTIKDIVFSPDSSLLSVHYTDASSHNKTRVVTWDTNAWRQISDIVISGMVSYITEFYHRVRIGVSYQKLLYSRDGETIIYGADDGEIVIADVQNGVRKQALPGHKAYVSAMAIAREGDLLATSGGDGLIRVWDIHNNRPVYSISCDSTISALAFSPDSTFMVSGDAKGAICVWDRKSGQMKGLLDKQSSGITGVAFSEQGKYLAASCLNRAIVVWEVVT